jgi:ubiquitin-protein ligase
MPIPDSILAKEYSLVMERAYAFEPIEGNLTKWRGFVSAISDEGELPVEVEIGLPNAFPDAPPEIEILTPITHPNINNDGFLEMRVLARWRPSYHLFQVIVEVIRLFSKVPARKVKTGIKWKAPKNQLDPLIAQKEQLSIILQNKKKELADIQSKNSSQITTRVLNQEKKKHFEDEILNVENELFAIESQFEDYEISSLEFSKKYFMLKKRLYLLEAKS